MKDEYKLPEYIKSQTIGMSNKMIDPEFYMKKLFGPIPKKMSSVLSGMSEEELEAQMALEDAAYQDYLDQVERKRMMLAD